MNDYRWAASLTADADVLVTGSAADGQETTPLVEHARHVDFQQGSLVDLPFSDDRFDAIVCFDAIEHLADTDRALDELQRVLRPAGLLLTSPGEIEVGLRARFANVAILRQQSYLASLLCDDEALRHQDPTQPIDVVTTRTAGADLRAELGSIVVATNGELPPAPLVTLSADDRDEPLELLQQRAIRAEADLAVRRTDAYWELYVATEAIARATDREDELKSRLAALEQETEEARGISRAVQRSASWRLTAPLRRVKRFARRR